MNNDGDSSKFADVFELNLSSPRGSTCLTTALYVNNRLLHNASIWRNITCKVEKSVFASNISPLRWTLKEPSEQPKNSIQRAWGEYCCGRCKMQYRGDLQACCVSNSSNFQCFFCILYQNF